MGFFSVISTISTVFTATNFIKNFVTSPMVKEKNNVNQKKIVTEFSGNIFQTVEV